MDNGFEAFWAAWVEASPEWDDAAGNYRTIAEEAWEQGQATLQAENERLRRALDNTKIRAYELGQRELHDMALAALVPPIEGET